MGLNAMELELSRKATALAELRAQAVRLRVEVGQIWEHIGYLSLIDPSRRFHTDHGRIRIVQVAGVGRARTTRYVKVNPGRGGNAGYDRHRQTYRIERIDLARGYRSGNSTRAVSTLFPAANSPHDMRTRARRAVAWWS